MSSDLAHEEYDRYFSNKDHFTSHPEDADDSNSDRLLEKDTSHSTYKVDDAEGSDDDSLHNYNTGNMSATATATYQLPTTLFDANTGPKGVIADAASYERAKKKSFRQTLYNIAQVTLRSSSKERSSSPELSGNEENDEEFMRRWRENRLRELQNAGAGQRRASPSKRRYGTLDDVDANGYLDAVEKLPSDTIVVVCIYDPEVSHIPFCCLFPLILSIPLPTVFYIVAPFQASVGSCSHVASRILPRPSGWPSMKRFRSCLPHCPT